MTILLYHEYVRKSVDKASLYLTAFSILGFSGVLALLFYWLFEIHWYDAIFQFGILLFIGLLFWNLIRQVSDDIRFRTEQKISEQIAREDRMTGFKNRLAFQEYLERIQNQAESYQNVVLTYILLENLNDLNNVYGTHIGDEAVIGAARCIERVCTATAGDCMELFRISGNEYAILYPNPAVEYIELDPYIQAEVDRYNRICTSQRRIRLACGYDCLRRKDGTIQSISGWKAGADAKLRENRKRAGGEMK